GQDETAAARPQSNVKVLLAGLGSAGQRHARNLKSILGEDVHLLAYRVRRLSHVIGPELRIESGDAETTYGLRVFANLDEALAEKPDAVFVTNPNSLHMPVALAAADAGCHLFIEKPLSHTLDGVAELIDAIERKHLVCLVGYQLRFHPGLKAVQSLLQRGAIGHVIAARLEFGEYLPHWHPYEDYRQMPASRRDLGGGLILSQIHDLDYAYALFGFPRRVFAVGGHLSSLDLDVEDTVSVLMDCVVDGRSIPVHLHQDCVRRPPSRTCEVIGDEGTIRLDFNERTVDVFDGPGRLIETQVCEGGTRNQLFLDELRHFLACLEGDAQPVVGARDGAQSLRMALAARESMETGRAVDLV
ncbi:MAG: Gfo/Idh/MocA family protein, partial [Thermoanaerobaculia bacterium]